MRPINARSANVSPSTREGGGWTSWNAVTVSAAIGVPPTVSPDPSRARMGVNPVSARKVIVRRIDGGAASVIVSHLQGTEIRVTGS